MPLDILRQQKNMLVRRTIARSYVKSSEKHCPICEKKQQIGKTMRDIKKQFHPQEE